MAGSNDFNLPYQYRAGGKFYRLRDKQPWEEGTPPTATGRPGDAVKNLGARNTDWMGDALAPPSFRFDRAAGGRSNGDFRFDESRVPTQAEKEAPAQRRLTPTRAESDWRTAGMSGASANSPDKSDIEARIKEIDSAMSDLSFRGGGLNMRSKRDMYASMMGMKAGLSEKTLAADTDTKLTNARLANEAGSVNARMREEAMTRRDRANQFNAGSQQDADKFNIERDDKLDAAKAPPTPKELLEIEKLTEDIRGARARNSREIAGYPKAIDDQLSAQIKAETERGVDPNIAYANAVGDYARIGGDVDHSMLASGARRRTVDSLRAKFSGPSDGTILEGAFDGTDNTTLTGSTLDNMTEDQLGKIRDGDTSWWRKTLTGARDKYMEFDDDEGGKTRRYVDENDPTYTLWKAMQR